MADTISEEQRRLNRQLHQDRPDFGKGGGAGMQTLLLALARFHKLGEVASLLDYGCGKGALPRLVAQALPNLQVQGYDPAVEGYAQRPLSSFDVVTSFDVLEHVERPSIHPVLEEIHGLSRKLVFLQIDLQPAVKRLASGRNAHILLAPPDWWLGQISAHFPVLGSYPVFHSSGVQQKIAVVAAVHPKFSSLVWSLLLKLQKQPVVIQGGYLGGAAPTKTAATPRPT